MGIVSLALSILINPSLADESIKLKAVYSGKTVWMVTATLKPKGACRLSTKKQPELSDCQRISFYALQTFSAFVEPDKPDPASSPQNPHYEFVYKNKTLPIEYKLAEECMRLPDSTFKCQENELTPAQKLLIELKTFAPPSKF